jgi:hypothetical protein
MLNLTMSSESAYDPPRLGGKGCAGVAVLGFIFGSVALLNSCVSRDEVARATSPDGAIVARLVESDGGATTDFLYTIHLQRNWLFPLWDYQVADLYGAGRSACAYGVNLRWQDNSTLTIEYLDAKEVNVDRSESVLGRRINVVLRAGVEDQAAPCGGMLYNQQRR